ncbi:hypothetical protein P154DRAFT_524731 [Amniculicola lignicola CBS 123094]|uniref:Uncharacterized protein n=1 Tax=Amniculicola lignicola CBS 123094 TaxID=1392246 RepID=A0A6A5W831_9PLEO|nr:hypothetical protein P154DRAFT_524731 [Amniculicola lignicola CBS 123094]
MSQPRIVITEPFMQHASPSASTYTASTAALPIHKSTSHSKLYERLRPNKHQIIMSEPTQSTTEVKPPSKRLSKRWSKQSATSSTSKTSQNETRKSKTKPTLTLWGSPSTRLPTTADTPSVSTPRTISTPGTSVTSSPTRSPSAAPPSTDGQNSPYDPLQNHIPCLLQDCKQTFCPSLLGPTFYNPQKPYGLRRLPGLCPDHAYADLRVANAEAKTEWELRRQNAGRKAMNMIAGEFDMFLKAYEEARGEEGVRLERKMRVRVLGEVSIPSYLGTADEKTVIEKARKQAEESWDWRYVARPCTKKGCQSNWYSIFDIHLYDFYQSEKRFRLRPLATLCPTCAKRDLDMILRTIDAKYEVLDDEVWHAWVSHIRKNRDVELAYWEKAQERVVRGRGIKFRIVEEKKKKEEVIDLEGKGVETVRELCVVM